MGVSLRHPTGWHASALRGGVTLLVVGIIAAVAWPACSASIPAVAATTAGRSGAEAVPVGNPSGDGASCLDQSGPLVVLAGAQQAYDKRAALADSTRVDARQASWTDAGQRPVRIGAGRGICFAGGVIEGTYADTVSWRAMHDTYALQVNGAQPVVEGVRIHNYGDGIGFGEAADGWTIRGAHLSFLRDDCVQNDYLLNGLIDDVLFDGCYVGYSARTFGNLSDSVDRSANVVTVRRSLWRLQRMPTVYSGPAPAHLGYFKLDPDGTSPRFALHDNVFFPEMVVRGGAMVMWPPPDKIASCANNVVVWLGSGDFPLPAGLPVGCVAVVRDRAVWDAAVTEWLARHRGR